MTGKQHYHVLAGMYGYMPDYNAAYETEGQAQNGTIDYVLELCADVEDSCENGGLCVCASAEFEPGHGVEYIEVSDPCTEAECWKDGELVQS